MNEQIRALAEEAGMVIVNDKFSTYGRFAEKFAELIVKQCGYYADVFEGLGCPQDMDPTETKPSDYIKRQFEVE